MKQRFNADPQHAPSRQEPPRKGDLRTLASGEVEEWNGQRWVTVLPDTVTLAEWLAEERQR